LFNSTTFGLVQELTDLLYLSDHYLKEFDAKVIAATSNAVELDRSAFYPTGGGQPSDTGVLVSDAGKFRVVDVSKRTGQVLHTLEGTPPNAGTTVHGVIDWEQRYRTMRHHSALHVLCGVVFHSYGSTVTGGNIYPDYARMDFDLEDLNPERVKHIEDDSNRIIEENRSIVFRFLPRAEALKIPDLVRTKVNLIPESVETIRIVEIEGFDMQADGGTHVAGTGEIGKLRIVKTENKGRTNRRMHIALEP